MGYQRGTTFFLAELFYDYIEQLGESVVGIECICDIIIQLILSKMRRKHQRGRKELEDGFCKFSFFQMFLYDFPCLCQGFGNLGYVEFTVCLYKRILHL